MADIYLFDQFGAGSHYSGPGNYFVNLINANSESSHNFHLVHGNVEQKKLEAFKSNNFICDSRGVVGNIAFSCKVSRFVKEKDIDVIQTTHAYLGSINAAKAGIDREIPTYLRIAKAYSELVDRSWKAKVVNLAKKKISVINAANGVVAISKEIERELLLLGVPEEKIYYIPNGVDLKKFNRLSDKSGFNFPFISGHIVIGFCGALIERKRPHLLLEVLKMLPSQYVVCFIGPYQNSRYINDMKSYIDSNQLSDRIFFTGFVNNPEDYLTRCDYFCLPSMNEGMPNALLEAMASGCVPIATDISGVRDVINGDDVGFIVEPDAHSIVDVIKNTNSTKEKYALAAYHRVADNFSASSAFKKYLNMYKVK